MQMNIFLRHYNIPEKIESVSQFLNLTILITQVFLRELFKQTRLYYKGVFKLTKVLSKENDRVYDEVPRSKDYCQKKCPSRLNPIQSKVQSTLNLWICKKVISYVYQIEIFEWPITTANQTEENYCLFMKQHY